MKRSPLPRRTQPLRKSPLARRSKKRGGVEYRDAKSKRACFKRWGTDCIFRSGPNDRVTHVPVIDAAHIYGKQAFPHLRYEPLNILPVCRLCHAHLHNKPATAVLKLLMKLTTEEREELDSLARTRR